ncbi:EXS family-domain-containing protein [Lactifluus subvellereus]|nr:EXS family-domain-containing protein [Lactifluus subvellereus]
MVFIFSVTGIDVVDAPDLRAHERGSTTPLPIEGRHHRGPKSVAPDDVTLYPPVYRLALCAPLVDFFKSLPVVCALVMLIFMLSPYDVIQKRQRDVFLLSIKRCIYSPVNLLGDVWLSLCMLLPIGSLLTSTQDGWYRWILPTLMSVPHLVRFRRCVVEYTGPSNDSHRPLWNVLKYASSFPVIFLSAAQRLVASDLVAEQAREARDMTWRARTLPALAACCPRQLSVFVLVGRANDWGFDLSQTTSRLKRPSQSSFPRH